MDPKVRRILSQALQLEEGADDEKVEAALAELGVESGRLFTQEEVNTLLGANKRHLRAENERLQREITEAAQTLADLDGVQADGEADLLGRVGRAKARVAALERQAEGALRAHREAQARAIESERDRALLAAAGRAGMIDPEREGLPLFRDRLRCSDDGRWVFIGDDSEELPVEEGIRRELEGRRHLLRPQLAPGAGTGTPHEVDPLASALERLERAGRPGSPRDDRSLVELADAVLEVGRARRVGS